MYPINYNKNLKLDTISIFIRQNNERIKLFVNYFLAYAKLTCNVKGCSENKVPIAKKLFVLGFLSCRDVA